MTLDQVLSQAMQHHAAGELQQAEQLYRQILQQVPNHPDPLHLLGLIAQQVGQLDTALELMLRAIAVLPSAVYLANVAEVYRLLGRLQEAEASARRAIETDPAHLAGHVNLGAVLMDQQRHVEAEAPLRRVIEADPNHAGALSMLGNVLLKKKQIAEAIEMGRRAVNAAPNNALAHNNLAAALENGGLLEEAHESYIRATELLPDCGEFLTNLGTICRRLGDLPAAIACWDRSLKLNPNYADTNWNIALAHLSLGDFERGWPLYEWRLRLDRGRMYRREYTVPPWDGSDLKGRSILLYPEQGYGDMLMFARFIPQVAERGGRVIFHAPPEMTDLLRGVDGVDQIVSLDDEPPPFDTHFPLLSLPSIIKPTMENLLDSVPYIRIDPARAEQWARRIADHPARLKVGLYFRGRPTPDPSRSCRLAEFAPLAEVPDVTFFSLQIEEARDELKDMPAGMQIVDLGGDIQDFTDSAAALVNLDLFITIDTAAAHLAGALGVKTWTMIPFVPDFRWLLDRDDSPWYPTMRLFRQSKRNDWTDVIQRLRSELRAIR